MTTLTKSTIITWLSKQAQMGNPALNAERDAKLHEMVAAGKTDNVPDLVSSSITIRKWVDQAAAEEYRDFITALATNYGDGLVLSAVIEDSQ